MSLISENRKEAVTLNRLLGGVETLLMTTSDRYASISSSIVRQVAAFGGDISGMVPDGLAEEITKALACSRDAR